MSHNMSRKLMALVLAGLASVALSRPALSAEQPIAKLYGELPSGAMQQKATAACLECHEARIILQQRLSKATWTKEVDKMIKWGAIVDPNDRDSLIDYLGSNFGPDQPAYEAARTSRVQGSGKAAVKKSAH